MDFLFVETSAKTGEGVTKAFEFLAKEILDYFSKQQKPMKEIADS